MDHKASLQSYFNGVGFERWSAIYGNAAVSRIRQTVREGHQLMLTQSLVWLLESHQAGTVLDAGCGTGAFSIPMAKNGFDVTAVDIAPKMAAATTAAAAHAGVSVKANAADIESTTGTFDIVACFDVLVHYPEVDFQRVLTHLAARSRQTLIFTYAPHSNLLAALHWLGGHFPQGQRRTEIQMVRDARVVQTLQHNGWRVRRTTDISRGFYHVKLLEAVRD